MLKSFIKTLLRLFLGKDISEMIIKDEIQVVSFDLFNTLINRSCGKPENVFDIVQEKSRYKAFARQRILAEKRARLKCSSEVNLDDIYKELHGFSAEQKRQLQQIEMETEEEVCIPNEKVIQIFNSILKKKIIVTDMYLPQECIERILVKCGVYKYDRLIVSCECGMTKKNGDAYKYALRLLDIDNSEILHIGDNPFGDYFIPKSMGIKAYLLGVRHVS